MINRELAELRRRFRADRAAVSHVYGCFVSPQGEILAEFDRSMAMMPTDEQEKYLELLKKGISGTLGRTLSELSFSTAQVQAGKAHGLLMKLLRERLNDADSRRQLYEKIAQNLRLADSNFLVLLASDVYDVPFRGKDDSLRGESGDRQFSYFVCSVCPVKEAKPVLRYDAAERIFRSQGSEWVAGNPELGFLFPAFEDRAANLYAALLYNRSKSCGYDAFVESVFETKPPMAVGVQADTFREVLHEALDEECSSDVVETVRTQLRELASIHKESRDPETLTVSCGEMSGILDQAGVSGPKTAAFRVKFGESFGEDAALPPQNLLNPALLEYKTPDAVIRINPDRPDLVRVREIGGVRCVVITADEGLEINGIPVQ
jgi:hypothetical protein